MSRESDNGFVCRDCGQVIWHDTCACSFEAQLFRTMRTKKFWLSVLVALPVAIVLVAMALAL